MLRRTSAGCWHRYSDLPAGGNLRALLFPNSFRIATGSRDTSARGRQFHDAPVSTGLAVPRPQGWKVHGKGRETERLGPAVVLVAVAKTAESPRIVSDDHRVHALGHRDLPGVVPAQAMGGTALA